MNVLGPIFTAPLFPKIEALLVELLRSLGKEEWELQTVAPAWTVKDVAAHLLDTELRKLSIVRDGYVTPAAPIRSQADLVALIDRLNREGVATYRRLSPALLISLLELAGAESAAYHASLDPFQEAGFPVSWAGESRSLNWFDTAREFTERWHHQQQIRLAVDRPGIMTPELFRPVLDCFMRALPFTYRDVVRDDGTLAQFTVSGDCGSSWYLYRLDGAWRLVESPTGRLASETTIPQEIAWRIFTKGLRGSALDSLVHVSGDSALGSQILEMVSIVG